MNTKIFKIRISEEFLHQDESILNQFLSQHKILKTATSFLNEKENFWSVLVFFDENNANNSIEKSSGTSIKFSIENEDELNIDDLKIYKILKQWRLEKAQKLELPAFIICSNKELMSIAKYKPIKLQEFLELKGFGEQKVQKFGTEILEVLESI